MSTNERAVAIAGTVNSDNIFTNRHDPSVYFDRDKPIIGIQKWQEMKNTFFKQWVDQTLEYESDYNFMRRMPLVYHADLFRKLREYISNLKGDIIDYLNTLETISEYNLLGAYAYKFTRESFCWIDVRESAKEWKRANDILPCTQYSSKTNNPRYIDIKNLKHL